MSQYPPTFHPADNASLRPLYGKGMALMLRTVKKSTSLTLITLLPPQAEALERARATFFPACKLQLLRYNSSQTHRVFWCTYTYICRYTRYYIAKTTGRRVSVRSTPRVVPGGEQSNSHGSSKKIERTPENLRLAAEELDQNTLALTADQNLRRKKDAWMGAGAADGWAKQREFEDGSRRWEMLGKVVAICAIDQDRDM